MTDLRKAAEMALDALTIQTPEHWLDKELQTKAIQALRQALAQHECSRNPHENMDSMCELR
jgi:hypothetical protein